MRPLAPLTCVTWHEIAPTAGPGTAFLGATTSPDALAHQFDHLERNYTIVGLDRLLAGDLPPRAALLTFDDAYGSIARVAAPMLAARKLPSVLFVNPGPVAQNIIPLDALASLFAGRHGASHLAAVGSDGTLNTDSFSGFMNGFVAELDLVARDRVKQRLLAALDTTEPALHRELALFMSPAELAALPELGMEVANHTLSHVHCGALCDDDLEREVVRSRDLIADMTGRPARAFAFPWGRQSDATDAAMASIRRSGHAATFLVHGRNNVTRPADDVWYRVLLRNETGARLAATLTLLPTLREMWTRMRPVAPFPTPQRAPQRIATS
jgi:peptidoglycan/xylan/chitin deacetylase (PgdA/CDA1 family)